MTTQTEKRIKEAIKKADEISEILKKIPDEKTPYQIKLCEVMDQSQNISTKLSDVLIENENL